MLDGVHCRLKCSWPLSLILVNCCSCLLSYWRLFVLFHYNLKAY
ncbi:uncharacterized protein J3R85_014189 [Psidium guajava]|nr:uncharacterized protein J3R85_014189 [Psidium guajava]